ncbi:DUF4041 domain-containing protein [Pontibacter vulgaris]|uniref:DUF4041 domain-containing protein n=1 Tax=Pontibacter vulgaris TaxID=2905679 RepID=UPI001FA76C9F|nr:DUF4041 domain-containing protein [Pontibacter vulgaris]
MEPLLLIVLVVIIAIWLTGRSKLKKDNLTLTLLLQNTKQDNLKLQGEVTNLNGKVSELEQHNNVLSKYQGIVDADLAARELLLRAELEATTLTTDAQAELSQARSEARTIRARAKEDAQVTIDKAEKFLSTASVEAKSIVEAAKGRAEEIAGEAYYALNNAGELERTAKAMKNIVDGYGDRYLVPTFSLLDDLAEEFSHTEAGERLKAVRQVTRLMIEDNRAAACEYAEPARRTTAIRFVLDAFNGKVDSILSNVSKDNYGTLEQQIRDAYQVVNNNGKAFRNAVITPEYLEARLQELKWAVVAQELKWQEKEEQRRIREQIREEEKARREFERAMKEAQKEEDTLKKLIEKAQQQASHATEEQKAQYELKLQELEGRLKAAEDKNQRALSMAQQTKSGNVYIISNVGSFGENVYKIGMTRRLEPLDRIKELGDASVPFEFDVHAMIYSDDAPAFERELHKKFLRLQVNKVNPKKEFFRIGLKDIRDEIERQGINAKWTMTAAAREYRESLALEQELLTDTVKQAEWERYQLEQDSVTVDTEEELEA